MIFVIFCVFHFYIIPFSVLIDKGYIRSMGDKPQKGKISLCLYPLENTRTHWTKEYIDRFDLLRE